MLRFSNLGSGTLRLLLAAGLIAILSNAAMAVNKGTGNRGGSFEWNRFATWLNTPPSTGDQAFIGQSNTTQTVTITVQTSDTTSNYFVDRLETNQGATGIGGSLIIAPGASMTVDGYLRQGGGGGNPNGNTTVTIQNNASLTVEQYDTRGCRNALLNVDGRLTITTSTTAASSLGNSVNTTTLNVNPGGYLEVLDQARMNLGVAAASKVNVNNNGGSILIAGDRFDLATGANIAAVASFTQTDGVTTATFGDGGSGWRMSSQSPGSPTNYPGVSSLTISGGKFTIGASGQARNFIMARNNSGSGTATTHVIGNSANITFYGDIVSSSSKAIWLFEPNAAGVSPIRQRSGTLYLNTAQLIVDLANYRTNADLVLFDYFNTLPAGTAFGTVTLLNAPPGITLEYGDVNDKRIRLTGFSFTVTAADPRNWTLME